MSNIYTLTDIEKLKDRDIFFDTNILLYLFWPTQSHYYERTYSKIFNQLLKQKNNLYIDFIVISEIINRVIRIEYENYLEDNYVPKNTIKFKEFRDGKTGKETLEDIFTIIDKKIFKFFEVTTKDFNKKEIKTFFKVNSLDFSDKGIEKICIDNNYILLTNDSDFLDSKVDLLTINKKLINNMK